MLFLARVFGGGIDRYYNGSRSFLFLFVAGGLLPVELEGGANFDSVKADDEVFGEDRLEDEAGEEGGRTEDQAKQVLLETELHGLEGLSTVFDHGELDDDGGHQDDQEQLVVEEVLEHVDLVGLQLTSVDLVEHLEEHEDVEEDGVVFAGLIVPLAHSDGGGDAEQLGT